MTKAAKIRVFLLAMATSTTLLALMPPRAAQACFAKDIYLCTQSNGTQCVYGDPSPCSYDNCTEDPATLNCTYWKTACC